MKISYIYKATITYLDGAKLNYELEHYSQNEALTRVSMDSRYEYSVNGEPRKSIEVELLREVVK